jgi:hypothetical protein
MRIIIKGDKMGFAKLNVWVRNEQGIVWENKTQEPFWDWVKVWNAGEYDPYSREILTKTLPIGPAHIEIEVPPGSYIVQGHYCNWAEYQPGETNPNRTNEVSGPVFITANCGQEICVNLIVPRLRTCAAGIINPLVLAGANNPRLIEALPTIMQVTNITPEITRRVIQDSLTAARELNAKEAIKNYEISLKIIDKIKVPR